jgi:competence protein ComEA
MKKTIVTGIIGVLSGLLLAGAISLFVMPEKGETIQIQTITPNPVTFHIDGAVKNPGVYSAPQGIRIDEAITLAGGLSVNADVSGINLSHKIGDEEKIYIPIPGEPALVSIAENNAPNQGRININTASLEELCELSGIGESKAADIIAYREEYGAFLNVHDLLNVPGIGQAIFDKIEPSITIE